MVVAVSPVYSPSPFPIFEGQGKQIEWYKINLTSNFYCHINSFLNFTKELIRAKICDSLCT